MRAFQTVTAVSPFGWIGAGGVGVGLSRRRGPRLPTRFRTACASDGAVPPLGPRRRAAAAAVLNGPRAGG